MLKLRSATAAGWLEVVEADLDAFLQDHAANERKVSHSALTLAVQHPDKAELVAAMVDLAQEELDHFARVYRLLVERGTPLAQDVPDPYMSQLRRQLLRADVDSYLLDRLVLFAIVEARGCERFAMLSNGLSDARLRAFYGELTQSEARHHSTYLALARRYYPAPRVNERLDALLDAEAEVARALPITPKLH